MSLSTPPRASLNVGIVGHGYATRTFHAPLIQATPGLTLTAIATQDPAGVRALHGEAVATAPDLTALLARGDLQLIVLPTPNHTHAPLAAQALAAGCHVVVDKPFTLDTAQAQALVAQARDARRVLSVFHNRRWDGDFLAVRALVASGRLGRLTRAALHFDRFRPLVRERWREQAIAGAGIWMDLGPHLIDQALQLFGWPEALAAELLTQRDGAQVDDAFTLSLRWPGGLRATLGASTLAAWPGPRFELHGTRGSARIDGLDPQEDQLKAGRHPGDDGWGCDDTRRLRLRVADVGDPATTQDVDEPLPAGDYLAYYATLRDALLGLGPVPVTAGDALDVMRLLDLGRESAAQRRELLVPAR